LFLLLLLEVSGHIFCLLPVRILFVICVKPFCCKQKCICSCNPVLCDNKNVMLLQMKRHKICRAFLLFGCKIIVTYTTSDDVSS
jgi:hypothetical protein